MTVLELPDTLKGPWDHALILTYGADIPFYEQVLSRQFASRCRNKIILMDGRQYLDACAHYADAGLVRHLNQRYVVEGIFVPHAAHAKIILLANPDRGRLLVGSGNLGWQGYASGGEIFTCYEYDVAKPQDLPAFVAVRELVEHGFHWDVLRCGMLWPDDGREGERHALSTVRGEPIHEGRARSVRPADLRVRDLRAASH